MSLFQSIGLAPKATRSSELTNQLYEDANANVKIVQEELQPDIDRALVNVDGVALKNRVTKQAVESISK